MTSIMHVRRFTFLVLLAVALGVIAAVWVIVSTPPRLALKVKEFRIGRPMMFEIAGPWVDFLGPRIGDRYVYVHLEASNATTRPLVFLSHTSFWPMRDCLAPTRLFGRGPVGRWVERSRKFRQPSSSEIVVGPGETFGFWTVIDSSGPCRIGLDCTEMRRPSGIWRRLPQWLTQQIFRPKQFTAMTDTINCADWQLESKSWGIVPASHP
jgi:hypothetical protein